MLVEVYGEGVLLLGESGVGKSETAIELVKRGHRLIADDAVEIKRNVTDRLVGTAPELIRHYIELRGIGVIDVCRLFGMSAVKDEAEIDMVINLEQWKDGAMYDRLGLENLYTTILDVQVPSHRAGAAWPKPGGDHRGGGHEQPPQEDGVQRRRGVYQADQPALRPGHECAVE